MLPSDKKHKRLRVRPAIDLPPVADARGDLPAEATMIVEPPIRLVSPNPAIPPVATIAAREDTGKPTMQTDPTEEIWAPPGTLVVSPPPRTVPGALLLLLAIPDPSRLPGEIATPAPAQEDAPAASFDLPEAPKITVGK